MYVSLENGLHVEENLLIVFRVQNVDVPWEVVDGAYSTVIDVGDGVFVNLSSHLTNTTEPSIVLIEFRISD